MLSGLIAMLLAVALASVAVPSTASAQDHDGAATLAVQDPNSLVREGKVEVVRRVVEAADPRLAYRQLSAAERAEFDHWMMPARAVQATPARLPAAPGADNTIMACWNGFSGVWFWTSLAGVHLYEMWMNGSWCTNDTTGVATSASYTNSGGSGLAPGWRHDGRRGFDSGVSGGQAKIWSQHRFILGAGGWDIQTVDHCMRIVGAPFSAINVNFVCTTV
jgi:hypothetical protein